MKLNRQGVGELTELYLENGMAGGRLLCPQHLIPEPGQYLLACDLASDALLPVPVFTAGPAPGGFLVAPPIPHTWQPGMKISLRGPLGKGFSLPESARHIVLVPLGDTTARLKPLLTAALGAGAAVALVTDLVSSDLPPEIEIQPVSMMAEVSCWSDYLAIDMFRDSLPGLRDRLGLGWQARVTLNAQVLIVTPMPCGGMAGCGVCAVTFDRGWKLACKNGPVFDLNELI